MTPEFAAHLAARHGLTTTDVPTSVITPRALRSMVARRELVEVHRGVYRHAAVPVTWDLRLRAGLLAAGPDAVVSHRAALARHGVRNFECSLVELTCRSRSRPVRDGLVVHRSSTIRDRDVVRIDGMQVTSRARTLVDVAALLPPRLVARYAHEWIADRALRTPQLIAAIEAAGRHPGAHRLARELDDVVVGADSVAEAELGRLLRRAGIAPELHVLVTVDTGATFELDWAFPDARLGLELDGYGVHLRSVETFDRDRHRRNELEIAGWRILNFTSRQLRRPDHVVDQVRRALSASSSAV